MAKKQFEFLPSGLSRAAAAHYIGVSVSFFDQLVSDGRMPRPKEINSRRVWDRHALDSAFDELPATGPDNPWDHEVERPQSKGVAAEIAEMNRIGVWTLHTPPPWQVPTG